ncbi:MAG: thiamine pyrophosphate-binding protein [Bacillota bacterium]
MTGAQVITRLLKEYKIKHIFGVPGDTSMAWHDALFEQREHIKHIACRDERSAAFMADTYARISGRPGVVEVPSGGGATYVVGGVSEANESSIPLICLASDIAMHSDETDALTELDQESLFSSVTKWRARVKLGSKLPHLVRKAFRMATFGRPGAVALSLPENILSGQVDLKTEDIIGQSIYSEYPPHRPHPDRNLVLRVFELLLKAKRPIVLAGGGVHASKAWNELEALTQDLFLPVVTSINGKGSVRETAPGAAGVVGANGGRPTPNNLLSQADWVLVLGSRLNSVTTLGGTLFQQKPIVCQVDIDPEALGNNIITSMEIMSDIREFLRSFREIAVLSETKGWTDWWHYAIDLANDGWEKDVEAQECYSDGEVLPASPRLVVKALQRNLPSNSILVADAGTPTPFISAFYRVPKSGRYIISPRGHGGLGYALPASLGAKIAAPDNPVVGLFGDGSFAMSMGDLETIAREKLPIILIHFENHCYGWIKKLQQLYYDQRYFAVDFKLVDYATAARALGISVLEVSKALSLDVALQQALAMAEPVMINVPSRSPLEETPPVAKWLTDEKIPQKHRLRLMY